MAPTAANLNKTVSRKYFAYFLAGKNTKSTQRLPQGGLRRFQKGFCS